MIWVAVPASSPTMAVFRKVRLDWSGALRGIALFVLMAFLLSPGGKPSRCDRTYRSRGGAASLRTRSALSVRG